MVAKTQADAWAPVYMGTLAIAITSGAAPVLAVMVNFKQNVYM